jgi:hypothetical protein
MSRGEFASLLTVGHISLAIVASSLSLRDTRSKDTGDIRMVVDEGTIVKNHALRNRPSLAYKTEHLSGPHTSIPDWLTAAEQQGSASGVATFKFCAQRAGLWDNVADGEVGRVTR